MREILGPASALTEAVDVQQNWKRFDAVPPGEWVIMYHATKLSAAKAILQEGFRQTTKVWRSSLDGYVFFGLSPRSIAMYGVHAARSGDPACILKVEVLKGAIEPDDGKDWTSYLRNPSNKRDVVRLFGKDALKHPSATVTLAEIGQARALPNHVRPLEILDLDGEPFVER
jgi:hypothetical protein